MEKKILVTGGAGYIGSHFVHFLINNGIKKENIIIFDNLERGNEKSIPEGVDLIKGDLKKEQEISSVFSKNKIDCVVHFAAYAYVGESVNSPDIYFKNNVSGGINLLNSMVKGGCKKIIFSSTCATYGMPEKIPISETEKQKPINPYGETKLFFEKMLEWYSKSYDLNFVCLRYFNAAGADFGIGEIHNPETHLIPLVIKSVMENKEIKIFGDDYSTRDGTCIRDYVHVTDLANAHFLALKFLENKKNSLKLNLGTGNGTSIKEIISLVEKYTQKKAKVEISNRREGDPPILIADSTLAKNILNWIPEKGIDEIVKSAINWEIKKITNLF